MATGRYQKWLEDENLLLLQGWKRNGLTDEQIAKNIGIAPRTLENWKKNHIQIMRALKVGKEQANFIVENALFKKATQGNTTAIIFWLKNNWRDKYADIHASKLEENLTKAQIEKLSQKSSEQKHKSNSCLVLMMKLKTKYLSYWIRLTTL